MLLVLLRLTSLFLALLDGFEHHRHVGYTLIAHKLFVGLLSVRVFTCIGAEGLTFLIIETTAACIMHLMEATMGLAVLAKLLCACRTRSDEPPPDIPFLGLPFPSLWAVVSLTLALSFSLYFLSMTCLMFSRYGRSIRGASSCTDSAT